MSRIIILRGNSGSGKSTVAKALQARLGRGTLIASQDCVRREMLWVRDTPGNMAIDLLTNLIDFGYKNCETTILEGILYSDIYRALFEAVGQRFAGNNFAYYFDLPFEETLRRHALKPNSHDFGETEMRRWWRDRDFLPDIREKLLDESMSLDEIVNLICRDTEQK